MDNSIGNNEQPMLSVTVLTYNQVNYVSKALDSILSQEHNYSYEIVVGDDCSTDGTVDVLTEYQKKYPDIIKLHVNEENHGLVKNYYATLGRCRGKYLGACAGDDWWLPGKVALQVGFMEDNPDVGMVYARAKLYYENPQMAKKGPDISGGPHVTFDELLRKCTVRAITAVSRMDLIRRFVEEISPLERPWYEDYPKWLWLAANSKIHFMDTFTGVYRIRPDSVSRVKSKEMIRKLAIHEAEVPYFFAERYLTEVPLDVKEKYLTRSLLLHCNDKDRDKINSLRGMMNEVLASDKSIRMRLVSIAFYCPWLYIKLMDVRTFFLRVKKCIVGNN